MHVTDRRAGARVRTLKASIFALRSERQQDQHLSLRLDANRDAVEMKRRGSFYRDFERREPIEARKAMFVAFRLPEIAPHQIPTTSRAAPDEAGGRERRGSAFLPRPRF